MDCLFTVGNKTGDTMEINKKNPFLYTIHHCYKAGCNTQPVWKVISHYDRDEIRTINYVCNDHLSLVTDSVADSLTHVEITKIRKISNEVT